MTTKEDQIKFGMAKTTNAIGALILALCALCLLPGGPTIGGAAAKRHGPLLVEDEGARRNRPAGKFDKFF